MRVRLLTLVVAGVSLGAFALCAMPRSARALEGQHHLALDPSLSILKIDDKSTVSIGAGLGVDYAYGINDQFNVVAEANVSRVAASQHQDDPTSPHTRPADVAYATVGIGYVIDILQFVPYINAEAGAYRLSGGTLDDALLLPGAQAMVGLDYQLTRSFAVGASYHQHFLFTKLSTYPLYSTITLRLQYMWGY